MLRYFVFTSLLVMSPSLAFAADFLPTAQTDFVPEGATPELLWDEGEFTEGPAVAPDGSIVFSDIGNRLLKFNPQTKQLTIFREKSGRANGLMYNRQGELIACEGASTGGGRRISITSKDGAIKTLSDSFEGKRFNSPNDLAIAPSGWVYFTDPRYGGDEPRELDFEGVFGVKPDGTTFLATHDVLKPNGILITPDGKRAYVADNDPKPESQRSLLSFDIDEQGKFTNKRVLFEIGAGRGIDGMTLDSAGNIYATAGTGEKSGVYIFSPEGKHLALIKMPGDPTNCTFGGKEEANALYITAAVPKKGEKTTFGLYRIVLSQKARG